MIDWSSVILHGPGRFRTDAENLILKLVLLMWEKMYKFVMCLKVHV